MPKVILDTKQVAALLNISPSMILKLCKLGKLPHFRIGKLFRFDQEDLERWIAENSAKVRSA